MQIGVRFHDTEKLPFEERLANIKRQGFSCTHIALKKVEDLPDSLSSLTPGYAAYLKHGSVTVGSEISGGVTGVKVEQCLFDSTDRGVRVKTRRGRGQRSLLDDITFDRIVMKNVHMPITLNMFYFCDPDGHTDFVQNTSPMTVNEMTPRIGSIRIKNMPGSTALAVMNGPIRSIFTTCAKSAVSISVIGIRLIMPALFTRISTVPNRCSILDTISFTAASSVTSQTKPWHAL